MNPIEPPYLIIIGGPNGAGKSTAAATLLPSDLTFVNADEVAKTLPDYPSPSADREAGRLVIQQLEALAATRTSFATETTLAGRSLANRAARLRDQGYRLELIFLWSPSAEFCVHRVASRVRSGGHHIPEDVIHRRRTLGLRNFFGLYRPIADVWAVFDATSSGRPRPIANGTISGDLRVDHPETWQLMREEADDES